MRYKTYMQTTVVVAAALTVSAIMHAPVWCTVGALVALWGSLWGLWRSVEKPLDAVQNGIYLLGEQDFASSLCHTGQPDADRVADMFNGMMKALKTERLKNLEQNNLLAQLVGAVPSGVAICDFDGRIVQTNKAFDELFSERLLEKLQSLQDGDTETVRLGQAEIYGCSRLWFMDSGFRRRFYVVQPLTSKIVEAEKLLMHKVIRTIGHEVNNTLGSTVSVLESLGESRAEDTLEHCAIDSCIESCQRLVAFVKRYASLVKLPTPQLQPTVLAHELKRLMPQLEAMARPDIKLSLEIDGNFHELQIDVMLIERVIVNIVKNAAESIGSRQGEIVIKLADNVLTVSDNGPGLSEEAAAQIFTPLFSTKHPDRGLGLMLIAEILRGHGAGFSLSTSERTVFEIRFKE